MWITPNIISCTLVTDQYQPRPRYTSSYLRPGSRFVGKQQSDKQVYKVEVTLKSVDIKESFLCGYLRIEGETLHIRPFFLCLPSQD